MKHTSGSRECHNENVAKYGKRNYSGHHAFSQVAAKYCTEEDCGHIQFTVSLDYSLVRDHIADQIRVEFIDRVFDGKTLDL